MFWNYAIGAFRGIHKVMLDISWGGGDLLLICEPFILRPE